MFISSYENSIYLMMPGTYWAGDMTDNKSIKAEVAGTCFWRSLHSHPLPDPYTFLIITYAL